MDLATQDTTATPATSAEIIPPANEPTMEQTIEKDWAKIRGTQERDDSGKFKGDAKAVIGGNTLEKSTEVPRETSKNTEESKDSDAQNAPVEDKAPSSWRKESQALWDKLPSEAKAEIQKRETDYHKGYEGFKPKIAYADEMQRVLAPHEQTFKSLGIQPAYAIKTLLETESAMRNGSPQQKMALFHKLATDYGVDLRQIPGPMDPYVAELQQKVSNYEGLLQKQRYEQQKQQQEQQAKASNQLTSTIENFAKDHEHLEAVRVHMGSLLASGAAQDMQDAYDQACWANPDIRVSLIAKQQADERAKAKQIAEEARRTGSTNVNTRGTVPAAKTPGTIDDTIREAALKLGWNPT